MTELKKVENKVQEEKLPTRTVELMPKADIYTDSKNEMLYLQVELPGVPEKDVDISLQRDQLNVRGMVNVLSHDQYEHGYKKLFKRVFWLSEEVETKKIQVTYNNGLLNIAMPIREIRAQKIKIQKSDAQDIKIK